MKAKKYKNKLIQLQILKLYYNKKKFYNFKTSLKQTEVHLNKISNIVYKYHMSGRRILFIGFPKDFAGLVRHTKHLVLPEYVWSNGMISNRISQPSNFTILEKKQNRTSLSKHQWLLRLKKNLDLVIVYNLSNKATAVKESYISRIPVITFNNSLDILEKSTTYHSPGNFNFVNEKLAHNDIFYSILRTALSRAISTKKTKNLKFRNITSNFFLKKNTKKPKSSRTKY